MSRQEFDRATRVEIIKRATVKGVIRCEQCGIQCKKFEVDHIIADGLRIDKRRKLTAKDGQLLCSGTPESCHGKKSPVDVAMIARAKRLEAAHIGAKAEPAHPIRSRNDLSRDKPRPEHTDPFPDLPRPRLFRTIA